MVLKKYITLLTAFSCMQAGTSLAATKETITLSPSSHWNIRYEDDSCRLLRVFGSGNQKVILLFSRFGPGDNFRLTLAGKPVRLRKGAKPLRIQFGQYEAEQKFSFLVGNLSKLPAIIGLGGVRISPPTAEEQIKVDAWKPGDGLFSLSSIAPERYANAKYLKIGRPLRKQVILETGSLGKPFIAFDKCVDELLTHWGIDAEKHRSLSKEVKPIGNPGSWIKSRDYPTEMLRKGQPALVQFRLNIDENGKPTACHIQQTTRPKKFDAAVCQSLMKRSNFEPARDAAGNPLPSFYRNTVRFIIP